MAFEPELVSWLDRQLPADGTSPDDFLDHQVTPRIVAGLPPTPGPVLVGVADDEPAVLPG